MRLRHYSFVLWLLLAPVAAGAQDVTYSTAPLTIKTHDTTLHFTVEVANTSQQQEHGLMFRKSLPDMHGMIFNFTPPKQVTFWMKNTVIPLDMLFIDSHGIVTQITANAMPESTTPIPSGGIVAAVLELSGGVAAKYHIASGDKVIYSLFQ